MTQETKPDCETERKACRCNGTGAYAVEIPIADAVVTTERPCPAHVPSSTPVRDLAFDTHEKRLGEVMAEPGEYSKDYYLRDPGGGIEWPAKPEHVEIIDTAALDDDTTVGPA